MLPPGGRTGTVFSAEQRPAVPNEIDLRTLVPGDLLVLFTQNTRYEFSWLAGGGILLKTDRADRPWGQVKLKGCVFHPSAVLAPGVVFQGGRLQYLSMEGKVEHQTTAIANLRLIRQSDQASRMNSPATPSG